MKCVRLSFLIEKLRQAENIGAARNMNHGLLTCVLSTARRTGRHPLGRTCGSGDIIDNIEVSTHPCRRAPRVDFTVATTARSRAKFHYYATPAELVPLLQEKSHWMRHAALVFWP